MRRKGALLCFVLFAVIALTGCGGQKPQAQLSGAITATRDGVDDFLALQKDFTSGYDNDTCYNITPQAVAENSDYRIFKYDTSCASFLLYGNQVFPMGIWLGGFGVTDMKLADIDHDGETELHFTFSWGSGMHRSQAGYFSPKAGKIVIFDYSCMNEDMMLVSNDQGGLSLHKATLSHTQRFVSFTLEAGDPLADLVFENGGIALSFPAQ